MNWIKENWVVIKEWFWAILGVIIIFVIVSYFMSFLTDFSFFIFSD